MFTGLVQRIGTVKRVSRGVGLVVEIAADTPRDRRSLGGDGWTKPLEEGESVAVNGVCLTVVKCDGSRFTADVLRETESRTGLGELVPGAKVNLERALRRGTIAAKAPKGRDFQLKVRCGRVLASQSVLKGSIAIDGVSLTISGLGDDWLAVDLIPTTAKETTLGSKKVGDSVNLEGDIVGKYVAKQTARQGLTEEALHEAGF